MLCFTVKKLQIFLFDSENMGYCSYFKVHLVAAKVMISMNYFLNQLKDCLAATCTNEQLFGVMIYVLA